MEDIEARAPEIYVQPGESHLVTGSVILRTVLGSCVGVAFVALGKSMAGFCHPMLPRHPGTRSIELSLACSRRYVDFAVRDAVQGLESYGVRRSDIQAKVFGGADVLKVTNEACRPTVGQLNCEVALEVLREEGIDVVATSLGGTSGLTVEFYTETGEVRVRRLS
ncbi:MAG TPA: chemotaxis protein CheD [Terracidiphilus sp.]|nr:chemotaxis protein CheD [Terracidiphilus sp.]